MNNLSYKEAVYMLVWEKEEEQCDCLVREGHLSYIHCN